MPCQRLLPAPVAQHHNTVHSSRKPPDDSRRRQIRSVMESVSSRRRPPIRGRRLQHHRRDVPSFSTRPLRQLPELRWPFHVGNRGTNTRIKHYIQAPNSEYSLTRSVRSSDTSSELERNTRHTLWHPNVDQPLHTRLQHLMRLPNHRVRVRRGETQLLCSNSVLSSSLGPLTGER